MDYHPDNPQEIFVDLLHKLDAELPAGKYVAQPKLDGRRRTLSVDGKTIKLCAKNKEQEDSMDLPGDLMEQLEEYVDGIKDDHYTLDCEWIGMRKKLECGDGHQVFVFDILRYRNTWLKKVPFVGRIEIMQRMGLPILPMETNPNLYDFFMRQLAYPISEGIVIRQANSGLVLGKDHCKDNPHWYKCKHTFVNRVLQYQKGEREC